MNHRTIEEEIQGYLDCALEWLDEANYTAVENNYTIELCFESADGHTPKINFLLSKIEEE